MKLHNKSTILEKEQEDILNIHVIMKDIDKNEILYHHFYSNSEIPRLKRLVLHRFGVKNSTRNFRLRYAHPRILLYELRT